jgi:hypothetical protein
VRISPGIFDLTAPSSIRKATSFLPKLVWFSTLMHYWWTFPLSQDKRPWRGKPFLSISVRWYNYERPCMLFFLDVYSSFSVFSVRSRATLFETLK